MSHASAPQTSANYDDERGNFTWRKASTLTGEVLQQDSFLSRNVSCAQHRRVCTRT
ncbi:hypothetical protein PISMIDRAFT_690360 [Pisolithus microcarpus 441]|uniref:Uncharacterized protein n=1 Tax=Pisolithus microcarpus 441 TaxID=765257 RepID=A0A0C9YMC6_9AGAM|nr:hypothetical protein PISMIDRAFT_690360 [Pisolithus microcarpus 441]